MYIIPTFYIPRTQSEAPAVRVSVPPCTWHNPWYISRERWTSRRSTWRFFGSRRTKCCMYMGFITLDSPQETHCSRPRPRSRQQTQRSAAESCYLDKANTRSHIGRSARTCSPLSLCGSSSPLAIATSGLPHARHSAYRPATQNAPCPLLPALFDRACRQRLFALERHAICFHYNPIYFPASCPSLSHRHQSQA